MVIAVFAVINYSLFYAILLPAHITWMLVICIQVVSHCNQIKHILKAEHIVHADYTIWFWQTMEYDMPAQGHRPLSMARLSSHQTQQCSPDPENKVTFIF